MKRKLQLALLGAVTLFAGTADAQNAPILPVKSDFGGTMADITSIIPVSGDYTLEVQGTKGTAITVKGVKYSYTPTTDAAKVRFVRKNGNVYIYEGSTYEGIATVEVKDAAIFPQITAANVTTSTDELLSNPGFETVGAILSGATDRYKFGTPWVTNVTEAASGIRIGVSNSEKVVVWRGSGNSNYFSQSLTTVKPNTTYKIQTTQIAGGNATATFNVGLGSTTGGIDYCSSTFKLGNTLNGDYSTTVTTPSSIAGTVYFTFKNTATNTASSGSDPVTQLSYISLVAATSEPKGIDGATSATYLAGYAYAPDGLAYADGTDATILITNPSFETGSLTGWVCNTASDTGVKLNSNSSYTTTGVDGSYLFNTWGGTAAKYVKQTLTNLPAGSYTVSALIASDAGNSINLYAGTATSSVGASASGKGVFVKGVTDLVQVASGGSLEIGITSTSWYKADNFVLTYYSSLYEAQKLYDGTDKMSAATKSALATAIAAGGGNENISALQTAITNATTSIASYKIISGGVPDNSLTNWTCANSNTFQVNTWSTEGTSDGTGMITPFIENWIASGSILSDGKITYTLAGLDPGYYKASSLVRIYSEAGNTISGASYFVGNKSIDIPAKGTSSTSGTKKIVYGTFSTTGEVNDDGILTFGVNIASATFNWLSIKSTTVSYIGTSNTEAYESALAAAQTALSNSDYANVTGDERTALQTAITNYSSITENYDVVADALTEVTSAFISAKASYDALITTQTSTTDPNLAYASTTVKTAFANSLKTTATSAADAMTKIAAIKTALRAYYESYAKAEGVEGARDCSSLITNTQFTNGTNGWTVTQNGGTSGVLSSEPWTAADGTTAYSYYDYYNSDTNHQGVNQTVTLDAGRYLLTIKSRAQKGLYTYITAGGVTTELQEIGNTGGVFDRGWNDGSVEFQILPNGSTTIEWYSPQLSVKHAGWSSFGDVRLVRLGNAIDTLDEKANYIPAISTSVDIILKHSFSPGKWNTICVPFPITSGEITSLLGSDAKVASFNSQSDDVLKFTTASSIEANKPYLVYIPAATTATSFNFEGKDVTTGTPEITVTDGAVTFVGTYSSMIIPEGNFFISNNTFYKAPGTPEVTLKPFRAYFKLTTPVAAKQMDVSIDGETTSISNIDADVVTPATIYNLNGQRVRSNATSTEGLAKGVYIMSGKSVVVK